MGNLSLLGLGALDGLHGALYGTLRIRRTSRFCSGVSFERLHSHCRALSRCRLRYRRWVVSRDGYRIPTQMHCVVGLVQNRVIRFLFGIGFLASIYGCYAAFRLIPGCSHRNW